MEPIIISASFFQEQPSLGILGRTGEHEARRISFDCGEVLKTWPEATILCVCRRPCDTAAYPISLTADGTTYTMPLTSRETAAAGAIKLELRAVRDDTVLKSAIFYGRILPSLNGQKDAPGNPLSDALNRLESTIANAQTLADEIRQKLDNGEFKGDKGEPGAKGDKGDKGDKGADGSDATVTAENIQSALGYAPVKYVQVAGTSVMTDGVANVPIASETGAGVVSILKPVYSGIWNDNGSLKISYATDAEISTRFGFRKAIVCTNLDTAVKAAMCDGKGAAWTADEQKAARERMGLDKSYELIEEITLAEETGVITRDTEPDGRAYNFTELKCLVIGMNSSGNNAYYALTSNRLNKLPVSIFSISGSDVNYRSLAEISCAGAIVIGRGSTSPGYNAVQATMLSLYNVSPTLYWPSGKIEGFILRPQNAQGPIQLMAGTKIMVYGVRA